MSPRPKDASSSSSSSKEMHWYDQPGADLALLSEMKASKADLKRFRRETEWLEERVSRPRLDPESDGMLDRALGLTIVAPRLVLKKQGNESLQNNGHDLPSNMLPKEAQADSKSLQERQENGHFPTIPPTRTTYGTVRLSSDSRIAFSQLKTNLIAETEEQMRLQTDQEILQKAVDEAKAIIEKNIKAKEAAEARILELQRRQPEVESDLLKVARIETAYEELMKQQQSQMDQEVQKLQQVLNLLGG
ncbi:hypothetical protein BGZ94_000948 [Podila epigama]|nr:hypothetical protein BGZ94_000948 [Podila epigama]